MASLTPYHAAPRHYRHYRVASMPASLADGKGPLSDYPWWSAMWDVLLTLFGAWMVEVAILYLGTLLSL